MLHAGQDCEFMHQWLKFFMTEVYKKNFASAGFDYLKSKGLNLTDWVESIENKRKGDFLTLYGPHLKINQDHMTKS